MPIMVAVDENSEEQIMECVDALDQFGDSVDGAVEDEVIDNLLNKLG